MHEFESFETAKFVGRLLGRGDWGSFIDKVKDVIPEVSLPAGAELAGRAGSAQAMYWILEGGRSCGVALMALEACKHWRRQAAVVHPAKPQPLLAAACLPVCLPACSCTSAGGCAGGAD